MAPAPTLEGFFAGPNTAALQHLAQALGHSHASAPVPTYLWGESGSGKTHLLQAVRQALREQSKATTTIIIAQRIASVQESDMILVMEEGRITASGTHEELLRTCDEYRSIYESQTKNQAQPEELQ